jgi:phosphatidylglycerophosphatase A
VTLVPAALAFATCLGLGYAPFAPGTFGSAAGLLLWAALPPSAAAHGAAIVLIFAAGVWSAGMAEHHFRGTDPAPVIIDEVMGMLVTLFMIPVGWPGAAAGFVLFRVFDVIKPPPANRLERLRGGMGIMADDFMAAVYANLALRVAVVLGNRMLG